MAVIEIHAGDVRVKDILQNPDRFSCFGVPDLDRFLTSYVELESDRGEQSALYGMVIGRFWHERPGVFKNFENSRAANQSAMLGDNSQASHVQDICDIECLTASVVGNVPDFNCALSVACDEGIHIAWTVNSNKWRVMSIKPHDVLLAVWIPNKDLEIETATHKNLVPLRVCDLSDSFSMAL